ncbi:terminase small subunit [Hymenobacter sp. 102]|uniref:terminase small subunit n=1 Tax=Hymenobacter sp. 102 TaxID=3403152 RepID=UPI003CE97A4A
MATGQPDAPTPSTTGPELNPQQLEFARLYAKYWKGARAAREAGYSANSAKQQASQMLKDERIVEAVKAEAALRGMSVEEAQVRMSEWGRVSLDDVMTLEDEEYTSTIQKPLRDIVAENYAKIQFEQELAIRVEALFTDRKAQKKYRNQQQELHLQRLIKHERMLLELEREPEAMREVDGPKVTRKVARIDMVKVKQHKAGHLIKKVTPTRYGTSVELHDAKDAVNTMLKIHGAFAPVKVDHTTNGNDLPGSNIMMPDNGRD